MECDWLCHKPAFIDFETQSEQELTTVHKYAKHPSTRVLTCCVKVDGVMHRFGPLSDFTMLERITEGRTLVAHNAPFDAAIWEHCLKLAPRKWYDTLPPARAAGFPGPLEQLGRIIAGRGKDKYGSMLIDMLCIVKDRRRIPPLDNPAYQLLLAYNANDVELLETIFYRVHGFGVPAVMTVDRIMNDRGIPVSREHLEALRDLFIRNRELNEVGFDELTDGVNANSPKQVTEWMRKLGFIPPNGSIGKHALRELQRNPEKFYYGDGEVDAAYEFLANVLQMRREIVRVGKSKVDAALDCLEPDGRIRDMLVIYGAGPGRWSGRGPQFHNMPVNVVDVETLDLELTYEAIKCGTALADARSMEKHGTHTLVADILCSLLRHMVQADSLNIADYGAVELRGAAYLAEAMTMLPILADPKQSIYCDMGHKLFNRPIDKEKDKLEYTLSKTLVLGAIYGMSDKKFVTIQQSRTTSGRALDKLKDGGKGTVPIFRKAYPEIPQLWRDMHEALHQCVAHGEEAAVGKVTFHMVGPDMHMLLPSGRPIVYRNAHIEDLVPGYCKIYGLEEVPVPTVVYDSPRFHRSILFGSKQTENADQGMCADFIADACVRCEAEGLNPIFTVHDELICESPAEEHDKFMRIMSTPPAWAHDFPMLAEGYNGPVWTKQNKRFRNTVYMRGECISDRPAKLPDSKLS